MPLPANFTFSQASLQDYSDCPRRFQLRYVLRVRWPAAREDSIAAWEQKAQLGAAFHRLVQQHTVGIPKDALTANMRLSKLQKWWENYLQTPPVMPSTLRQPEVRLTTPLSELAFSGPLSARHRLMARYDLLAIEPGTRAVIVDWKTNEKRPLRTWLEDRWQTRVYRYVLVRAGAQFNVDGAPWMSNQVELLYWFANHPAQPERFPYDDAQYTEDEWAIKTVIAEIDALAQDTEKSTTNEPWPLTDKGARCTYCTYRTLCDREKEKADEPDWEPDDTEAFDLDLDLEQIAEIEF